MKCKYCTWTTVRFNKKRKSNARTLFNHAIEAHQEEFLKAMHCASLTEYMSRLELEED